MKIKVNLCLPIFKLRICQLSMMFHIQNLESFNIYNHFVSHIQHQKHVNIKHSSVNIRRSELIYYYCATWDTTHEHITSGEKISSYRMILNSLASLKWEHSLYFYMVFIFIMRLPLKYGTLDIS